MADLTRRIEFTPEMKKGYQILIPGMMDIHFRMLRNVFVSYGYHAVLLTNSDHSVIDEGLKYVHNDTCYPALLTIGQIISALKSGQYDINQTAVMMSQTGGGCRASNYIHLLRKALANAGLGQVPVISLNLAGLEKSSGFRITIPMLRKALAAMVYGDALMLLHNQTYPYELIKGESQALVDHWVSLLSQKFEQRKAITSRAIRQYLKQITASFESLPIQKTNKVKVGVVGEIYLKYSPLANNHLEQFLAGQGCEVMVPGVLNFLLYMADNSIEDIRLYGGKGFKKLLGAIAKTYLLQLERDLLTALRGSRFSAPSPYQKTREMASPIIGHGCKMGEGWLLTAEMMELVHTGYENIVCVQPFGCLPNHIAGKGTIRQIRQHQPSANIVAIDYDPGATKVNQENRIKLMLSVAREQMQDQVMAGRATQPDTATYREVGTANPVLGA